MGMGLRIIEDATLTIIKEDWSKCKSKSRAMRREKRKHKFKVFRQNVVRWVEPDNRIYFISKDAVIMHPSIVKLLKQHPGIKQDGVYISLS